MLVVAGAVGAACLLCGGGEIRATEAWTALWTDTGTPARTIVHELRLPRTVAAFGVGGLLAMAGCLMQVLVRNPLADPYTLGLSGGAAAEPPPRARRGRREERPLTDARREPAIRVQILTARP